jgi:TonB family protein
MRPAWIREAAMVSINRISCAGYGAYELKATYQRNLLLAMLITTLLAAGAALLTVVLQAEYVAPTPAPRNDDGGRIDLGHRIDLPRSPGPRVGGYVAPLDRRGPIPEPIPDSLVVDEDQVILSTAERANLTGFGETEGVAEELDFGQEASIGYDDPLPPRGTFVWTEVDAELIYSVTPEYPRLAKEAEIEGRVVIQALVGKNGDVLDAFVFAGSGSDLLDAAALAVAWKYKYRPAVQNGLPVAIWVSYTVEFKLEH